ncbi:uncharacterized protein LOC133778281 [Humulus lupulus]|uniref:uncharacterized protein LOC133778281 n=1 Tax=Humulus lupulus TaxID=3486 RepID=UPI002B40C17D|nr:uncharacterized protein LOC133778281 [Humulus lupulus]XP_062074144.1 uncharacterized protein LOC133778281 [Humulus lupulus]
MGALASISPWIPEDDLLLKNSVEAGASLESLAKGAVQFSRKFTVRELQDRWLTLLYDPIISAQASALMIEFERSASMLPSKFNRFGNLKENKCVTGKRKVESIRSCYYDLRKRICNEPFNSMDITLLVGPTNSNYVGNGDKPLSTNCMLGDAVSNPFGLEVSEMDNMTCAFPNDLMDADDGTIHTFHTGLENPAQENFSVEQNNMLEEIPHVLGENMPSMRNVSGVEEMGEPTDLAASLFQGVEIEVKNSPAFNQVDGDQLNMCPEFEGNKGFNSSVSGSIAPFNSMEYLSPLPRMPVDNCLGDRDLCSGDSFHLPDDYDARNTRTSGFDVHSEVKVKMESAYDNFQVHDDTDNYLAELSNSLLDFNDEELMCMDTDGRDMIDKSYYDGLSSLLLNSPNDVGQDQMTNITEVETSIDPDMCTMNSSGPCPGELHDDTECHKSAEQISFNSPNQMQSSISASNLQFPELEGGVICCVLNTEDPVVPCNDNVFISNQPAVMLSTAEVKLQETTRPLSSSVKDFSSNQRTGDRGPNLMHKERKPPGDPRVFSQHVSQEMGLNPSVGSFRVKLAASKSDSANMASKVAGIASSGLNSANSSTRTLQEPLKEETREMLMAKHLNSTDISLEKPALGSASFKNYPHTNAIGIKEEHDGSRDQEKSINAELTPMNNTAVFEPLLDNPTAEQDGVLHESEEDDIPCYSDIEAMVLDMDLDPDEQDLHSSEEVSRYQHEETKRAIVRLEQSAHSYMQRAIASHGALAILYGRRSKHYIKKPEVLLGRATFESPVDIDLGREGRSNKISRRQAIIKMDKGGSFSLKNLSSRFSISVNNKEVGPQQSLNINSSCLIEIRGMPFIFETNPARVKMYLDSMKTSHIQEDQL